MTNGIEWVNLPHGLPRLTNCALPIGEVAPKGRDKERVSDGKCRYKYQYILGSTVLLQDVGTGTVLLHSHGN